MQDFQQNTLFKKIQEYVIPSHHPKSWLLILVICILFVSIIYLFMSASPNAVTMKKYTDSLDYFNMNVPKNWTTEQEQGNNTTGLNTVHPISQQIEISQLYPSAQEGITIQVYKGTPTCPLDQSLTTTLASFPAAYNSTLETWTIPTTKATITISISYPGSNSVHTSPLQAATTPIPVSVVEKNKEYMMGILKTLVLTNLRPFTCH